MIRGFFLIWMLYFSALSLMPCSDIYNDCELSIESIDNHQHQNDQDDLCSPFCSCNCCSTVVILSEYHSDLVERLYLEKDTHLTPSIPFLESNFSHNIWQPPKI